MAVAPSPPVGRDERSSLLEGWGEGFRSIDGAKPLTRIASVDAIPPLPQGERWDGASRASPATKFRRLTVVRSPDLIPPVELRARAFDFRPMFVRPFAQRFDRLPQPAAEIGQLIIDPRRNGREYGAGDQAVALQAAQRQGQHPLRDAADHALDLVEAARATSEHH